MDGLQPQVGPPPPPEVGPVPADEWRLGTGLAVLLAYFAIHTLAAVSMSGLVPHSAAALCATSIGNCVVVVLLVALAARMRPGCARAVLGLVPPDRLRPLPVIAIFLAGVVAYLAVTVTMAMLWQTIAPGGSEYPRQNVVSLVAAARSRGLLLLAVVLAVGIAPLAEELVFRLALYLPVRRALGVPAAAVIVSVVFAAAHGYLWGFPQLVVLSVMFVGLYEVTGSLWASVLGHAAHNSLMLCLLFTIDLPQ